MRVRAPAEPGIPTNTGTLLRIRADAPPASNAARMYFQTAAITGRTPKAIGFPAYQKAGMVRIQN